MFFSRKKSPQQAPQQVPLQAPPSPVPQQPQQAPPSPLNRGAPVQPITKVEDEVASFEIPDFTEDDLNFDLGIGEFMPDAGQSPNIPPQVQRQPMQKQMQNPSPAPLNVQPPVQVQQVQPIQPQPVQQIPEPPAYEQQELQEEQQYAPSQRFGIQQEFPPPPPDFRQEERQTENMGRKRRPEEYREEIEDEIPKFEIDRSRPELRKGVGFEQRKKEGIREESPVDVKKEISSLLHEQAEQDLREQRRGIFMPNIIYEKVVILTEDTVKQSNYSEGAKTKISSLIESKRQSTEDLKKLARSVVDSLLDCDTKLFEKVMQDGQ